MYTDNVTMTLEDNVFAGKFAAYGGAISVIGGSTFGANNHYINNSAYHGGAISVEFGSISSTSDNYINNHADHNGGAIYASSTYISSARGRYISNSANFYGGVMYIYIDSIHCSNNVNCIDTKISSDNFEGYSAVEGAVIYKIGGTLEISQSRITDMQCC